MAVTWTNMQAKAQRWVKSTNSDVLTQLKEDMNTGYHLFNAKLSRYYTRKQQFTNLVAAQQIYQTPIDSVRISGMTVQVTTNWNPTVKEIRSEYEWRRIVSYPMQSNWPTYYFMLGNDEFALWPIPSQTVVNGLRFYYQPQDHDLSVEDVTSTTTAQTVTVTNGSTTVTASGGSPFNTEMVGLWYQTTGVTDLSWYEIVAATATTLTLKSAYVGLSGASKAWRVGQLSIIPQEYSDAPLHYAVANFFSAQGNEVRQNQHMNLFDRMQKDCEQEYSSSNISSVMTEGDGVALNIYQVPPPASPV
jgi:hypothetical protein